MIDRPLVSPFSNGFLGSPGLAQATSLPVDPNAYSITNSDGTVDVYLEGASEPPSVEEAVASAPFNQNLAEVLPDNMLSQICSDIRYAIDEDKQGRRDWEDALTKGMDLLGIKDEARTTPWPGACGVVHPMIHRSRVRFQSKSHHAPVPASRAPRTAKVVGESQSKRRSRRPSASADDLNYWLTEKMLEYRDETEQLLFAIPVDGCAFKKIYFDPLLKRPVAQFVPANDFLMPYGFPNLETCPRYTHVMKKAYGGHPRSCRRSASIATSRSPQRPVDLDRMEEKVSRLSRHHARPTRATSCSRCGNAPTDLIIEDRARRYVVTLESDSNRDPLDLSQLAPRTTRKRAKVLS